MVIGVSGNPLTRMYFLVVLCYTMLNCLCIFLFMFGGSLGGAVRGVGAHRA